MQGLTIEVVEAGSELALVGRLDTRSAPYARTSLHQAVDSASGDLVLRADRLEIWDSHGLGVLVGAYRRARQRGRSLVLTGVRQREARVLRRTRLDRLIRVEHLPLAG
ncbi:MAG: STAS domain-containing protein [Actinomycetales bacterium]|nr:STAS domain-containing protein [Actinomycetales bacterium]